MPWPREVVLLAENFHLYEKIDESKIVNLFTNHY